MRYRAVLSGGEVVEGAGLADWLALRDRCFGERRFLLRGRLYFNDGLFRHFGGWAWCFLIEQDGGWTIDDHPDADAVLLKYRDPVLIPGGLVLEAEMHAADELLKGAA